MSRLQLALTGVGAWELTYFNQVTGNPQNRRLGIPLLEPIEIPYLTDARFFLVGATYLNARPTWRRAGYLYQQIDGIRIDDRVVYPGLESIPSTEVDYKRILIQLNTIQLIVFEKLTDTYRLRFEPLPWIPEISLGIWEYRGTESDTTEDLIQALRTQVQTIDFKIDNL